MNTVAPTVPFPERITDKRQPYRPLAVILNGIKKAVDDVHGSPPSFVPLPDEEPTEPELFADDQLHASNSDFANISSTNPSFFSIRLTNAT
ncbi:hypothetical protein OPQ81_011657 [Rhizoctonia solani]|nr:hypothetical protein OPQ81_011657 [Rhizoctonia solani]